MKIGIVGAGNIGGALTRLFRAAGHEVTVANTRGPVSLADLSAETGARAAVIEEAVRGPEVVVVAVPMNKIPSLPRQLFAATPADVVVIDTSNYYPQQRDGRLDGIEDGSTESEWVEQHLGRPVIKAFNTIEATHLQPGAKPAGSADRIALAVAGDDTRTKSKAMALIDGMGFDAVDAGVIAESWRQQPGSPGYLKDYDIKGVRGAQRQTVPALTSRRRKRSFPVRNTPPTDDQGKPDAPQLDSFPGRDDRGNVGPRNGAGPLVNPTSVAGQDGCVDLCRDRNRQHLLD